MTLVSNNDQISLERHTHFHQRLNIHCPKNRRPPKKSTIQPRQSRVRCGVSRCHREKQWAHLTWAHPWTHRCCLSDLRTAFWQGRSNVEVGETAEWPWPIAAFWSSGYTCCQNHSFFYHTWETSLSIPSELGVRLVAISAPLLLGVVQKPRGAIFDLF